MKAMSRIPYCRILIAAVLLTLIAVPMASARTVDSSSVGRVQAGDWFGAALRWVEDLVGLRPPGHRPERSGPQMSPKTTAENSSAIGGTCIDPMGRPKPCF
jgi:hypothetical protein